MKDDDEHPVPTQLRERFQQLIAAFATGDLQLITARLDGIAPIDRKTADSIAGTIAAYGSALAPLREETWERSVYRWMDGEWQFLIDLSTIDETVSDLVLHARLADDETFRIEVQSIHVP